jgi:hypothetical protein
MAIDIHTQARPTDELHRANHILDCWFARSVSRNRELESIRQRLIRMVAIGVVKNLVVSKDGLLHAINTQAIGILSYGNVGAFDHERLIDLSRHLRYTVSMGGDLEVCSTISWHRLDCML